MLVALISCAPDPSTGHDPHGHGHGSETGSTGIEWTGEYGDRVARLSHVQWENTVQDLLGLSEPTHLSDHFVHDATKGTFNNESKYLFVTPVLEQQYQDAAEVLTGEILDQDPSLRDRVLQPSPYDDAEGWIRAFGKRVHRRPLTDRQVAAYLQLFAEGAAVWRSGDDVEDGTRQVLEAMLQSPWFLYRVQSSGKTEADGSVPLDAYDLASKLSYAVWNTMPDDHLFELADSGELLDDQVYADTVSTMLDDPRAHATLQDLHTQLYHVDTYGNIAPDVVAYPQFGPDMVESFQQEVLLYLDGIVYRGGGLKEVMTSHETWVDPKLADLYGVGPVPDDGQMHEVELDPTERSGLLTLAGRLALQADPDTDSPIRRGIFINNAVLCVSIHPPPAGVNPKIPEDEDLTTRQRVDAYTGYGTCGESCHAPFINPPGYAYEHYGALGEWRDTEHGLTLDATGTYLFEDGEKSWDDAVGFAQVLGDSSQVHKCYARNLLTYLYGHSPTPTDEQLVAEVGARSLSDDEPIRDILADLLASPAFRYRTAP